MVEEALTTLLSGAGFGLDRANPSRNLTPEEAERKIAFTGRKD
ncbi:hypothetical protein AB0K15_09740 [Amycolatopsis sp. NPDC049253]